MSARATVPPAPMEVLPPFITSRLTPPVTCVSLSQAALTRRVSVPPVTDEPSIRARTSFANWL